MSDVERKERSDSHKVNASKIFFENMLQDTFVRKPETNRISLGYTELGDEITLGIKQMGHTLISGLSRSGKTQETLHILKSLIKFAKVSVYSPKDGDYFDFRNDIYFTTDHNAMSKIVRQTASDVRKRAERVSKLSKKLGVQQQCNEEPLVVIIDEMDTFLRNINDTTWAALQTISEMGMGMNIFIYYITQTPSKKSLKTLRNNILTDIAFRQRDSYSSRMAIGDASAARLELRHAIVRNVIDQWEIASLATLDYFSGYKKT